MDKNLLHRPAQVDCTGSDFFNTYVRPALLGLDKARLAYINRGEGI